METQETFPHRLIGLSVIDGQYGAKDHIRVHRHSDQPGKTRDPEGIIAFPDGVRGVLMGNLEEKRSAQKLVQDFFIKIMRQMEREFNSTNWMPDSRNGIFCLMPMDWPNKKGSPRTVCGRKMSKDEGRWTAFFYCNRPVYGNDTQCKTCLSVERRGIEREEKALTERRERVAEYKRIDRIVNETRELWDMVCDQRDIDPERRGGVHGNAKTVSVDNELLREFLRELIER